MHMTFNRYQKVASRTDCPVGTPLLFAAFIANILGFSDETLEFIEKLVQIISDNKAPSKHDLELLTKELGDILWYTCSLSRLLGSSFEEIALLGIHEEKTKRKTCLTFKEYFEKSIRKPKLSRLELLGRLAGKVAIVTGKFKRICWHEKGKITPADKLVLLAGLSETLLLISNACSTLETTLEYVAIENLAKIASRIERKVQDKTGDER